MSKVVHLSDDAHARAKVFCKDRSVRMSDWVAALIDTAIAGGVVMTTEPGLAPVSKRKELKRFQEIKMREEVESVYAAPPFWAGNTSR